MPPYFKFVFSLFTLKILAWIVLLAAIIPFICLTVYTHPTVDDFWLTNMVIATDAWQAQQDIRQTWSGRYMAMFFASINPLVYRSFAGYQIMPLLMFLLTYGALLALVKTFLADVLSGGNAALLSLLLLVLHIAFMPTVAQGYYWLSGSLSYQAANIFMLLLGATLGQFYRTQNANALGQYKYIVLATILLFVSIGCNETNMAVLGFLMPAFLLADGLTYQRLNLPLLYLVVITGICCALVYFAPGNLNRLKDYPEHGNLFFAGTYAFTIAINNSLNWLTQTPVLALTILFIPLSFTLAQYQQKQKYLHPFAASILYFLSLTICFFVSYWSKGNHAPPRVQNNIYLVFLIGWFFTAHTVVAYFKRKYSLPRPTIPGFATWLLSFLIGLTLLYNKQSNIRIAYSDLLSGRAARYSKEMDERYAYLKSSTCQSCPIEPVINIPKTIFFEEVDDDTTGWRNLYTAQYFGKRVLLVKKNQPVETDKSPDK